MATARWKDGSGLGYGNQGDTTREGRGGRAVFQNILPIIIVLETRGLERAEPREDACVRRRDGGTTQCKHLYCCHFVTIPLARATWRDPNE